LKFFGDIRIVNLTRNCKPFVFYFYIPYELTSVTCTAQLCTDSAGSDAEAAMNSIVWPSEDNEEDATNKGSC